MDFDANERHRMFEYVANKYGYDFCALVSTRGNRKTKSAIRDTGKVYGIDKDLCDYVAKLIPEVYYIDDEDGGTDKKTDLSIEESIEIVPELKELYKEHKEWFDSAGSLTNIPKSTSIHAGGVLISPINLKDNIPLIRSNNDKISATSLTLEDAEHAGLIKYDFLSICTLGVINKIKKALNIDDVYKYIGDKYDDEKVWDLIGSKHTAGLFQIGTPTYRQRMGRLAPRTIEQLAACLALVRGPCIASKADEKYMNIVQGKEEVELIHPIYDRVTADTNGILLYQEQFMQIFVDMGFSMEDSYIAMKAAAKKKKKKLKKYKKQFLKFSQKKDMSKAVAERIFKILVDTGLYSFNLSHAIAYAILSYITGYFKVYHPLEFFSASLTNAFERKEETKDLIADCYRLGIKFKSLDINNSEWKFKVEDNALRVGFSAVKCFSESALEEINRIKDIANGYIDNLDVIVEHSKKQICGKKAMVPAIFTGAFDYYNTNRAEVFLEYLTLNGVKEEKLEDFVGVQGSKDKLSIYENNNEFEKMYFGIEIMANKINELEYFEVDDFITNKPFKFNGYCDKIKKHKTKNGSEMAFVIFKTGGGDLDIVIFPKEYELLKKNIKKNKLYNLTVVKNNKNCLVLNNAIAVNN